MKTLSLLLLLLTACTHVSRFTTNVPGARLYVDGIYIGQTPVDFSEKTGARAYDVRIERDGYRTIETRLSQDEYNNDVLLAGGAAGGAALCGGCLIGTFGCCWPFFYSVAVAGPTVAAYMVYKNKQLHDSYHFALEPLPAPTPEPVTRTTP